MTTAPFTLMLLATTSGLCLLMSSWLHIWVMLEMNTLAFCVMMSTNKKKKNSMEMAMKYFIIQSMASAFLFLFSISVKTNYSITKFMLLLSTLSIMIKVASVPFHPWFINMVNNMKWKISLTLMTWQKLAPCFLILYQVKTHIFFFILVSALTGVSAQMNKIKMTEILAFSSVFNLSWMMAAITLSSKTFIVFSSIYWLAVVMMMLILAKSKMKMLSKESMNESKKGLYLLMILNLGGIPPTATFLAKWSVFSEGILHSNFFIFVLLLTMSGVNLFIYMRMINFNIMNNNQKKQKELNKNTKSLKMTSLLISILPVVMVMI